jgi:hypothetical protein
MEAPVVLPAVMVAVVGESDKEKSAGAGGAAGVVTFSETVAVCASDPEVPVRVTFTCPAEALDAAVRITFWDFPGLRVSDAGVAVTPEGTPEIAMLIVLLKMPSAVAVTIRA